MSLAKPRMCLGPGCSKMFQSPHPGIRFCDKCRKQLNNLRVKEPVKDRPYGISYSKLWPLRED